MKGLGITLEKPFALLGIGGCGHRMMRVTVVPDGRIMEADAANWNVALRADISAATAIGRENQLLVIRALQLHGWQLCQTHTWETIEE